VDAVDFRLHDGEAIGIIGPNGSGKSTFFNVVTGIYPAAEGEMQYRGRSLQRRKPHEIARLGIARTFQNLRLFSELSALDNVIVGMHARQRSTLFDTLFRYRLVKSELHECVRRAEALLGLFSEELVAQQSTRVADLPYADRKRVEICRALAAQPTLLLLDEPAGGMSPSETEHLMRDLGRIRTQMPDMGVIVIEHDMEVIETIAERVSVFNYGRKIAEGPFAGIAKDPAVIEAYLGEPDADAEA
jgi:branched-chain amino acid transport system ATP-binding protein